MKNLIFLITLLLYSSIYSYSQGEQHIWTFGDVGIDFNTPSPTAYTTNLFPAYEGAASVCDANGHMQFYTNGFWVWDKNHEIMPALTGGTGGYTRAISPSIGYPPLMSWTGAYATQATAIARRPTQPQQYYIFSLSTSGQLFYSIVDMTLNNGRGDIVPNKKSIVLASGLTEKLTVVKGCNNIWVMARTKTGNQYKAFEINDTGIVTTPVLSSIGNLPPSWYQCGVIKFSPDGLKMAAACNEAWNTKGGLELYDFDPHTGKLSHAILLDSSRSSAYYYGACFSPDNSKLYATTSSFSSSGTFYSGKVHQFDLNAGAANNIIASRTVIFSGNVYALDNLGDLKRAKDGKIYFGSGQGMMHSISHPNLAGMACAPLSNVLTFPSGRTYRGVPNDIALLALPDSVHTAKELAICFKDTGWLIADTGKLYLWDDGSTTRQRMVRSEGIYTVSYINWNCQYETDSIHVRFIKLPKPVGAGYSCPGKKQGRLWIHPLPGDTTTFLYTWKDAGGTVLRKRESAGGDTIHDLDTGLYYVQLTTRTGCDTVLNLKINALPTPDASFAADSTVCLGETLHFINTSSAPAYKWIFGDGSSSEQKNPDYTCNQLGTFSATLIVTNIEGCSDTTSKETEVKGFDIHLDADKLLVNKGEVIELTSSASESFNIAAWKPANLFLNQNSYHQTITMDTSVTFEVTGASLFGCADSASVTVEVRSLVLMPTAFSPNGDGLNDRFRPRSTGPVFVRIFEVYNRFGQCVYKSSGKDALNGWDGTFKGNMQELGTYYYFINIEINEGGTIALKGDVTLVR
ncbi:MAG TPA: gliding motility-associated C-terminal domain-containing protein [Flavipsychrobacter sp.]|nr:gliding motility-associated C-terminal domain-containing protein [Flavipsychrobacter sp.]